MQLLEVSGAVRPIYGSLGVKRLIYVKHNYFIVYEVTCFDLFKMSSSGL